MASDRIVRVRVDDEAVEVVADRLWSLGAVAVAEADGALEAGFEDDADATGAACALEARGFHVDVRVDDGAWRVAWRDGTEPVAVGSLRIRLPSHDPPPDGGAVDVVIEPGDAFGSGTHPTTRLALLAIADVVRPGSSLLDVGTGSGILAVAAAKLGAGRVLGIDVDPAAVSVAAANAAANGVAGVVEVATTPLREVADRFDAVVANLGGGEIVRALGPDLARRVAAPHGVLVLSGLLRDVNVVDDDRLPGLRTVRRDVLGDWYAVRLRIR